MPATIFPPTDDARERAPEQAQGSAMRSTPAPARSGPSRRGRASLAVLLATAAFLGGGSSVGILAATGALDRSVTTTTNVVRSSPASASMATNESASLDAQALYASTSPGVVDISATGVTSTQDDAPSSPFGGPSGQSESTATGTGFVIDADGYIVTAWHVVAGASSVTVTLSDGTERKATVTGQDDATDVAVLKIDASGLELQALELAESSSVDVGTEVAAIGDPFGYERSITTGIVSGVDRTIEAPNGFTVAHAIQTDAAVNPGNSGGPLLNADGEVIGMVDQIATSGSSQQNAGVGFAVSSDVIQAGLDELKAGREVRHAYLGVATAASSGSSEGVRLDQVTAGGPAADAGLRDGDVVTKIGEATVRSQNDLVAAIAEDEPGEKVAVTVTRDGREMTVDVTLGTQPTQRDTSG